MALIFSTHSRLWKLPFEIIVSKIYSYFHVKLEVNRIEIHRDEVFVVGFYGCKKGGLLRWVLNVFQMFSLNIESNNVRSSKEMYTFIHPSLYKPLISWKIEILIPEYKCTGQMLSKIDQDLPKIYCKKLSA